MLTAKEIVQVIKDNGFHFKVKGGGAYDSSYIRARHIALYGEKATFCPVTAYCFAKTGQFYHMHQWGSAAQAANLPHGLAQDIVSAADNLSGHLPEVRQELMGLVEETKPEEAFESALTVEV